MIFVLKKIIFSFSVCTILAFICFNLLTSKAIATIAVGDIPTLSVWVKADDLALSNGAAVSTWQNNGSGADFTQGSTSLQPSYVTNQVNSKPVVRFDGVDDYMQISLHTGSDSFNGEVTVFSVAANKRTSLSGKVDVLVASNTAGSGNGFAAITANGWNDPARNMAAEGNSIQSVLKRNGDSTSILLNKDEFNVLEYEISNLASSETLRLGKFTDNTFNGQNDIAELLIFNSKLSTAQKKIVYEYLSDKYAINTLDHRSILNLTTRGERYKGAMYWPKMATTPDWWPAYRRGVITDEDIREDLSRIHDELGVNTIRVFVFYDLEYRKSGELDFTDGNGNKSEAMLAKLSDFIDIADEEGLDVIPSLFQEMESSDATQFGVGTTLVDNLTYHKEYVNWLSTMISTKDNVPAIIIINEPDGFGAWANNTRAENILTWLREIKTEINSVLPDMSVWVNTSTHDNVFRDFSGAPSGSQSIYEITDVVAFNSFLWADNGYWEYSVPPITFQYVLNNNTDNKPVILMEFGHPSHDDDDGIILSGGFWDKPVGSKPTTPSTEAMQKKAVGEFTYWTEKKYFDGASVWSALDHPTSVYRDPFGLIDDADDLGKPAAAYFKRMFTGKFDENGEVPISLLDGTVSDGTVNGVDGTTDVPAGVYFLPDEHGIYTSNVLPYKLPLGIKLDMQQSDVTSSDGIEFGWDLRSAGVNKPIRIIRDEAEKKWTLSIDNTIVAASVDDSDAGIGTDIFTVYLIIDEDGLITFKYNDQSVILYDVISDVRQSTVYDTTLSSDDMASDLVLSVMSSSQTDLKLLGATGTGGANYPLVLVEDNSQLDRKKLINNIEGYSVVRASNWTTDVESTPQWGTQTIGLVNSEDKRIAEINVNFDTNRDWSDLFADSSIENKKAVVHYAGGISNLPGISDNSFILYIPKAPIDTSVYICPNAETLNDISTGCSGGYSLNADDDNVEIVTISGQQYWKVSGLTGTGGVSTFTSNNSNEDDDDDNDNDGDHQCNKRVGNQPPYIDEAIPQGSNSILLKFREVSDPIEFYSIKYGYVKGIYNESKENIGVKPQSKMEYLVENLSPNSTYYFRIRANNGCKAGDWSNEIKATTKGLTISVVHNENNQSNNASVSKTNPSNLPALSEKTPEDKQSKIEEVDSSNVIDSDSSNDTPKYWLWGGLLSFAVFAISYLVIKGR